MTMPIAKNKCIRLPNRLHVAIVYLVTTCLTMGCTTAFSDQMNPTENQTKKQTDTKNEDNLIAKIPATQHKDILYMLLTAELAASRHQEGFALQNYLKAAELTQDPAIAEQATQLAINLQSPTEAALAAELWAKTAPDNLQAQLIAMTLSISQSSEKSMQYLIRAMEINPFQFDLYIVEIQARLSDSSARKLKELLNLIANQKPKNPYAQLAAALSAAQQGDIKSANRLVDVTLTLQPDLTQALQLKARLIRYSDDNDASALGFLAEKVNTFPNNKELRLFYSSALMDNGNVVEAELQLRQLTDDKELGGQALVLLGEVFLKENQLIEATKTLEKAINFSESKDLAQFLLGESEERQGHDQAAIEWYSNIAPGNHQISGYLRAAALLKKQKAYKDAIYLLHNSSPNTVNEQKQIILAEIELLNASNSVEEAMQLANEVLPKLPNDADILYTHAITAIKLKKWEVAEADLRKILKQNPNNAKALNALGYTISFNKTRVSEALEYLNQALSLAPNNPFYMDTIGWTYFRIGDIQQATTLLEKANKLTDDGEVAAHFGEVLWASDHKKDAIYVWKKAYEKNSDDTTLQDTLKRLKINLDKQP